MTNPDDQADKTAAHEESQTGFSHWQLPDVTPVVDTSAENMFGRKAAQREPVEVEQRILPPTLAEIEEIRAEAETEGFSQGQQQGYQEGLEKGRLAGLEQGHQEGFSQGHEQGLQEGLAQAAEKIAQFDTLLAQFSAPLSLLDTEIEQSLVKLSMSLARCVIGHELNTHPEHILTALRQGIDALPLKEQGINVRLHPEDLALVHQLYGKEQLGKNRWQLESDPSLRQGECVVSNVRSRVDMGLEHRIAAVFEGLVQSDNRLEQQKVQQQQAIEQQLTADKSTTAPIDEMAGGDESASVNPTTASPVADNPQTDLSEQSHDDPSTPTAQ
ncbi:flagellar assembly protein FliH [Shewanella colwelliana]|uniref:flagellar assembly protein FliH n=1 Tax=Shewanella colwelliana TaxID=23 RepID=UPI0004B94794|nr:flagellar assembly protein FliH [Shewanella colwelliana]